MQTRREFLKLSKNVGIGFALGILCFSGCSQTGAPSAGLISHDIRSNKRPNIVFIMADDLGWGDLGCYGQKITKTPNIDKLASQGVRFTDCYAGAHMCAPSRATLLTSKHENRSTVREIWERSELGPDKGPRPHLNTDEITIADVLKKAGYSTALFGKSHAIGGDLGEVFNFGFDRYCTLGRHSKSQFAFHYSLELEEDGKMVEYPANKALQAQVEADKKKKVNTKSYSYLSDLYAKGRFADDIFTEKACDFISQKSKSDDPFFLYLSPFSPHTPFTPPNMGDYKNKKQWNDLIKSYVSMVEHLDYNVGRVLAKLKEAGVDDNTIVFFTSDNGGLCREPDRAWQSFRKVVDPTGGLRKGKHIHYEGGIRVPMIVRWPGKVKAASTSDVPWYFADMMPTLANVGKAQKFVPRDIDGVDVLETILGKDQPILQERPMFWAGYVFHGYYQVVRKGDWKLIRWTKQGHRKHPLGDFDPVLPDDQYPMIELYNLKDDPKETNNLADKNSAKMKELLALLYSDKVHVPAAGWELWPDEQKVFDQQRKLLEKQGGAQI